MDITRAVETQSKTLIGLEGAVAVVYSSIWQVPAAAGSNTCTNLHYNDNLLPHRRAGRLSIKQRGDAKVSIGTMIIYL